MQNVPKNQNAILSGRPYAPSALVVSEAYPRRDQIDPRVWQRPDMRMLLAVRDIAGVYRLLQRYGLSQRAIAARTGQSQSEISEILAGRRHVTSYELLLRICEGLGVPRGWMGLAYDAESSRSHARPGGAA